MSLKLNVLRHLKNLNKLVLKGILSKSFPSHQMTANLSRLASLSIVNCRKSDSTEPVLDPVMLASIGRMTNLTKLDLDDQTRGISDLSSLTNLSNLTQLRLSFASRGSEVTALTKFGKLKKLG